MQIVKNPVAPVTPMVAAILAMAGVMKASKVTSNARVVENKCGANSCDGKAEPKPLPNPKPYDPCIRVGMGRTDRHTNGCGGASCGSPDVK